MAATPSAKLRCPAAATTAKAVRYAPAAKAETLPTGSEMAAAILAASRTLHLIEAPGFR